MYKIKTVILCVFMSFICKYVNAQSDSTALPKNDSLIVLDLTIYIDSISYDDTSYVLSIKNFNNNAESLMKVSNRFYIYLQYDTKYELSIFHPTTNCKAIIVDTHAPKNEWLIDSGFKLTKSSNKEKILVGAIVYDSDTKTFIKKKIE